MKHIRISSRSNATIYHVEADVEAWETARLGELAAAQIVAGRAVTISFAAAAMPAAFLGIGRMLQRLAHAHGVSYRARRASRDSQACSSSNALVTA